MVDMGDDGEITDMREVGHGRDMAGREGLVKRGVRWSLSCV